MQGYILFGNREDFQMFNESYSLIKEFMRRGRAHCNDGNGDPPIYVNVHMRDGSLANTWVDALQAAFAGVQVKFALKKPFFLLSCQYMFLFFLRFISDFKWGS